jgi:hypothetical protein
LTASDQARPLAPPCGPCRYLDCHDHDPAPHDQDNPLRHPLDPEEAARAIGAAAGEGEAEGVMFTARSALTLLAESPNGSTEQLMLAYGYPAELITKLIEAGFATATTERVIAGNRALDVKRIKINNLGRTALKQH